MNTVDRLMHLADNFASLHRYSSADAGKARATLLTALQELTAERDEIAKTGNEWYESYNNKRIECDALRQAWEGSKQIIKMIEAERDAYQVAADKLAGEIKDMQRQEPMGYVDQNFQFFVSGKEEADKHGLTRAIYAAAPQLAKEPKP